MSEGEQSVNNNVYVYISYVRNTSIGLKDIEVIYQLYYRLKFSL